MAFIDDIIKWIMPSEGKNRDGIEKDYSTRFVVTSMVSIIILGTSYLFFYIFIRFQVGVIALFGILLIEGFSILLYQKYGKKDWIGNLFGVSILVFVYALIFSTGGLYSPVVSWIIAAVISFFWFVDRRSSYIWGAINFVLVFVLYFLTINGHDFPITYDLSFQPLFITFSHLGLFMYLLMFFSVYEIEHKSENRQLELMNKLILEKNDKLEAQRLVTEEKSQLLEEAYKKLEDHKDYYYHKLMENGGEVLCIVDKNGLIKFISSTIEKEFGYKPSKIIHESAFKHVHPSDLDQVYLDFQTILKTPNKSIKSTYRYEHQDGTWYYVESFAQNLLNDKEVKGIVINFRNINDYIKNQQKVSEKERYYRSLIENSSDIISIIDIEGKYQYLSPSFEKQFGHFAIDFIGEDAFQYIHPDDVAEVKTLFNKVKKIPGWQLVLDKQYRTPDKSGTWRYLESAVHNLIDDPIIKGIVINTRIVDEKVLSQKMLEGREKYYRSLIENSMDLISVRNENAVITYCSPSTRHILGYEEEELIGTTGFHLIHPNDKKTAEDDWDYMMSHPNEVIQIEQRVKRKDGVWIFVEAKAINLLHIEGVNGVVSNFYDITQRKEAERIQKEYEHTLEKEVANKTQQLKEQNNALAATLNRLKSAQTQLVNAEKMASLGQLTAGIAHEINNPINFVSGNIFPLKTDFQDIKEILKKYQAIANSEDKLKAIENAEKQAQELDVNYLFEEMEALIDGIEEGANRTRDIVVGLRNFSRLDEDSIKSADVHAGMEATLVLLKNKTKNSIKIERNYDESIEEIECYPGKLNQVFMNLLSNAIQAIDGKGTIKITTENKGEEITIKIEDTGSGMSDEVKEKIFEPFFTTKDVGKGTGLGLSITYGIIEQHKGKIIVNSELGKGSEFVIVLPKHLE